MYIEQGYKGNLGMWKYLVLPLGLLVLGIFNYISTAMSPVSVDVMMRDLIDKLGSSTVLIIILVPLALGLFVVWGWVKLVHEQTITSLTTSRIQLDWRRIFSAFFLWDLLTIAIIGIDIALSQEAYIFNFRLVLFLILLVNGMLLIQLHSSFDEYMYRGYM